MNVENNEFSSAFEQALKDGTDNPAPAPATIEGTATHVDPPAPAADPAGDPAAIIEPVVPAVDPAAAADPAGDPAAAAAAADPNAAPAAPAVPEAKPAAPADPNAALLDGLRNIVESAKPAAPAAAPQEQPAAEEPRYEFTPEQAKVVKDFQEEYPEIYAAQQLILTREMTDFAKYMFDQIGPQLGWMRDMLLTVGGNVHHSELRSMIPEYDGRRDAVVSWVEAQPSFLQEGMKRVIESGTAEEVKALFAHYEKETGISLAPPAPASAQPVVPTKGTELPDPAKKAAVNLAPVSSSRSAPKLPNDPNDYSGAWKQAAEDIK